MYQVSSTIINCANENSSTFRNNIAEALIKSSATIISGSSGSGSSKSSSSSE